MQRSPVSQSIVNVSSNGILNGYLRACKGNVEPSADLAIYREEDFFIGRDPNECQLVVQDPTVSNRHCRIYSVVFDDNLEPLVYVEDLSSNGTYWNGSFLGKGHGGALLSNDDVLRISPRISYTFETIGKYEPESLDDIQEAEKRLMRHFYTVKERKLGAGAYGHVYLAVGIAQKRQLACKIVNLRTLRLKEVEAEQKRAKETKTLQGIVSKESIVDEKVNKTLREVEILKDLNHPNIIRLEKVFKSVNTLYIFEELITGGDLFSYISSQGGYGLKDLDAAVIVRQIVEALKYLHENEITHRDLKPDNILITSSRGTPRVVLTDFGHAIKIDRSGSRIQRMLTTVGTMDYVAPEVHGINKTVLKQGYTKAVDMWSLGTVTSAILAGRSLFVKSQAADQRRDSGEAIKEASAMCDLYELDNGVEWEDVSFQAKDFVKKLLVLHEEERMTAVQALKHEWFTNKYYQDDFDALYRHAIKDWMSRHLPPPDIFADLEIYANAQKPYTKVRRRHSKPIEPHYQPPNQKVYQLLSQRRRHTQLPTISETNAEPPNGEGLRISEELPGPKVELGSVDTIIPYSSSALVENASKVNESRWSATATARSRKSRRRFIFDIEEDEKYPVPVKESVRIPSPPHLSSFTSIIKRKYIPGAEEDEGGIQGDEIPFQKIRKGSNDGPLISKKRTKTSVINSAQSGCHDSPGSVSRYWSSAKSPREADVEMRTGVVAQSQIQSGAQQSLDQDSTPVIPPPPLSIFTPLHMLHASESEDSSNVQEITFRIHRPDGPQMTRPRQASSFVDPTEVEIHQRAGRKTRNFRTAKAYGQDVAEVREKLTRKSQTELQNVSSGDMTDSVRTAY